MKSEVTQAQRLSFRTATASRIPVPVDRTSRPRTEVVALRDMQPAPAPVGRQVPIAVREHWSATFVDLVNHNAWRREALDAFVSHSFTGQPGTERWCTRCTLMLPSDWQDFKKPVPLRCGDPRIVPQMAAYEYVEGNPLNGLRPVDPNYAGAKVRET